ncbi:MAG: EMC3/TMCO1 family protein [archaeon]
MAKSTRNLMIVMAVSLGIAFFWPRMPIISQTVHYVLDPTAGVLLNWNATIGIALFSAAISLFITLIQKYTTDQETLRQIKKEQKLIQAEIKKYKHDPEKVLALNKKQFEFLPRTMDITLRPIMYTSIPIILFFRWFNDYFAANPVKIFGFMSWFWAYILMSFIFTPIFRKVFNVA